MQDNLAPEGKPVAFEMVSTGIFRWIGYYDITSDDLLSGGNQIDDSKLLQARTLLKETLSKNPMLCAEAYELCKKHGIGKRTTESAKRFEKIKSIKMPDGWYWKLEEDTT